MSKQKTESICQWQGRIVQAYSDTWQWEGQVLTFDRVMHPGGVAILALNDQRQVAMLRQYRPCLDQWLYELPAGKREVNEDPFVTAQRELKEEIGATAQYWQPLGRVYASPGVFTEEILFYLAYDLTLGDNALESGECLSVEWWSYGQCLAKMRSGALCDAKTLSALFSLQVVDVEIVKSFLNHNSLEAGG
jgi:ADP-ribose pyrophosphatase